MVIATLFNLLALIYLFRGLQILRLIWQGRANWQGGVFTQREKSLAEQASFFLAVPIGVFFHEFAHALAIWFFGGGVEEFGYRVFWGFVQPTADTILTAPQEWFVALAGTLGSLVFGALIWLILSRSSLPAVRYFGLRAFRYQIFFSLIYYPLFTLLGFYGDWRIIYDFSSTPILSALTMTVHLASLAIFWWAGRIGWFEMPTFRSAREREQLQSLEARAAANPYDPQLQLQLIEAYRQHGEKSKAMQHLRNYLKENPKSAEGHLELAVLYAQDKRQVPKRARDSANQALDLGISNLGGVAYANQLLGQYSLGVNRLDEAIGYFNQGLAAINLAGRSALEAQLRYLRAVAYRRKNQYYLAQQDILQAIELARDSGQGMAMSQYQAELATIKNHAGQSSDTPQL